MCEYYRTLTTKIKYVISYFLSFSFEKNCNNQLNKERYAKITNNYVLNKAMMFYYNLEY